MLRSDVVHQDYDIEVVELVGTSDTKESPDAAAAAHPEAGEFAAAPDRADGNQGAKDHGQRTRTPTKHASHDEADHVVNT
jgi:hypothetical protein